jgi:hypothetical protein
MAFATARNGLASVAEQKSAFAPGYAHFHMPERDARIAAV